MLNTVTLDSEENETYTTEFYALSDEIYPAEGELSLMESPWVYAQTRPMSLGSGFHKKLIQAIARFQGCNVKDMQTITRTTPQFGLLYNLPAVLEVYANIKYGLLYNWYAATDARLICAEGWEVPTNAQINTLISYAGGLSTGGAKLKETGLTYFNTPNTGATNEFNFNGRGCGSRSGTMVTPGFYQFKLTFALMSSDLNGSSKPYVYQLQYNSLGFFSTSDYLSGGHNLRPIKTTTTLSHGQTGTYTGNDGKVYRTICIGTQEWLADNLCETKYRNGDTIPEVTDNSAWAALTTGALCAYNNDWDNV